MYSSVRGGSARLRRLAAEAKAPTRSAVIYPLPLCALGHSTAVVKLRARAANRAPLPRVRGPWAMRRPVGGESDPSPRIRRVQEYVEIRVGEVVSLDELAAVAGLSRFHFARIFREEVGTTPWTYVREVRARRARELLRDGRSPAEAAHEAGFSDQSHLTRTMREIDGRTPAEYRRAHRRDGEGGRIHRKIVQDSVDRGLENGAASQAKTERTEETTWNLTSPVRNSPRSSRTAIPSRNDSSKPER